jgi:hypothetical protein
MVMSAGRVNAVSANPVAKERGRFRPIKRINPTRIGVKIAASRSEEFTVLKFSIN